MSVGSEEIMAACSLESEAQRAGHRKSKPRCPSNSPVKLFYRGLKLHQRGFTSNSRKRMSHLAAADKRIQNATAQISRTVRLGKQAFRQARAKWRTRLILVLASRRHPLARGAALEGDGPFFALPCDG